MKREHPVIQLIRERYLSKSKPTARKDPYKLGLVIEGGGMRGVVSAGMVTGLEYLELKDVFDNVYGSSAGSINGAFFLSGQASIGTTIYYENINNNDFLKSGFRGFVNLFTNEQIMDLRFLLDKVMTKHKILNWVEVVNSPIKLNVVVSSLEERRAVVFNNFKSRDELFEALQAGATMPIVAGSPINIKGKNYWDASIYESIPINIAIQDNCSHLLVLRTRPEGALRGQPSWFERHFFANKIGKYSEGLREDFLNRAENYRAVISQIEDSELKPEKTPFIYSIKVPKGQRIVKQVETKKSELINGAKNGLKAVISQFIASKIAVTEVLCPFEFNTGFKIKGL